MKRLSRTILLLAIAGFGAFWLLTQPERLDALPAAAQDYEPDMANGERMFHAGGCSSCHAAPGSSDKKALARRRAPCQRFRHLHRAEHLPRSRGRHRRVERAGFRQRDAPRRLAGGSHYYPAFPYTSYQRMRLTDLLDLKAYLDTLPKVAGKAPAHEIGFPFNLRRGLGLWKLVYLDGQQFTPRPMRPIRSTGAPISSTAGPLRGMPHPA